MTPFLESYSPEIREQLTQYAALLEKWNAKINLVSRETISEIWTRHIADSSQLAELILPGTQTLADLGSGGGLPGIVLAILRPEIAITLVERDQRKSAFLREAIRHLGLSTVTVRNEDIATLKETYQAITARALAPLERLCTMALSLCGEASTCYFPKGKNFATELTEAEKQWQFRFTKYTSKIEQDSVILVLSELKRRG